MVKTSLVTGGAGFIGAHVVRQLLTMGHRVIVLDDLSGGFAENIPTDAVFVKGSITDSGLVDRVFADYKIDYVYHLAAYAAEGLSHFIRRFNYNNNLIGSVNLINCAVKHHVSRFIFTSSIAVYGALPPPMVESMTPMPADPYGIAKYAVELDLKSAYELFGLEYTIFRPHNVYGEYQNIGDKYRNVIGIFMNQLMRGEDLSVFGDGLQTRAFSYISDVAPVIARCIDVPESVNEVFNIGSGKPYTILELAATIQRAMGIKGKIKHLDARNEVVHAYADHSKAQRVFGISGVGVGLEEGISRMAAWAKGVGSRQSMEFGEVEIVRGMPEGWG